MPTREVKVNVLASRIVTIHREGRPYKDIALHAGYRGRDAGKIMCNALGVYMQETKRGGKRWRYKAKTIAYEKAVKIAEAAGISPTDVNL